MVKTWLVASAKGVSSLTQPSTFGASQSDQLTGNQQLRAELSMWDKKYAHLEEEMKVIKEQLVSGLQRDNASTSTSQFHHQYDPERDDQPLP